MNPFRAFVLAAGAAALLAPPVVLSLANKAAAQTPPAIEKMNAYVGCINRLSARSYDSRSRYFSWADKSGPTGRERIIYGTYTIDDTSDCKKNVEKANALEPHDAALEAAATAYAEAVSRLEPLLKEADDYYTQQDYKDDKMAKGRAGYANSHGRLPVGTAVFDCAGGHRSCARVRPSWMGSNKQETRF